jgi:cell division transport system permease protein
VLVIGNTVRLAIENRRAEIVVVKLVGGTDAYVSRPFLYTGLWYGVGGGLLAVLLVAFALFVLQGPVSALMQTYDGAFQLQGLGVSNSFAVLAGAGLLGWLGAWVSVLRHLRAIEPR